MIETDVHPGFSTDWQQPFTVLLTQAEGSSIFHETVHENRFGFTKMLVEMGADIEMMCHCLGNKPCRYSTQNFHHSIIVKGCSQLEGRETTIPDLRAGFAYLMAALIANGESTISGMPYLDRGYENLVEKLTTLGADVTRIITHPDTTPLKPMLPEALTIKALKKDKAKV